MLELTMEELQLLGTRFHRIKKDQLFRAIVERAGTKEKTIIAHVNVRAMNLAYELRWYRAFLNKADIVFCDGFGGWLVLLLIDSLVA